MRKTHLLSVMFIAVTIFILAVPGAVSAQGDSTVSLAQIDSETIVTVKETNRGEILSLYKIRGDRFVLVDSVINTSSRTSSDTSFQKRYLVHMDVDNR